MKHKLIVFIAVICLFGFVLAESDALLDYFTARDWFSMESARNAAVPEGLTEREEMIYRAGFAGGHYDALNPEYIEGLFVLNTKTQIIPSFQLHADPPYKHREPEAQHPFCGGTCQAEIQALRRLQPGPQKPLSPYSAVSVSGRT